MKNDYTKNKYYLDDEIAKAKKLAIEFYNKKHVPQLLRLGNKKLGSNVAIWDLPSVVTCKYQCKGCYAIKAERMYKNTRLMRAFHYEIIKLALEDNGKKEYLQNYIQTELNRHKLLYNLPVVRIHSSGDFYNPKYLAFWLELINNNPDIKFYTYTKAIDNSIVDYINNKFNNFNIVKSLIDNKYINYGDIDYIEKVTKILDAERKQYFVCGYGFEGNNKHYMGNCTACLHCPNVIFKKH